MEEQDESDTLLAASYRKDVFLPYNEYPECENLGWFDCGDTGVPR